MRIISGTAKGHPLKVPKEVSRPTTDRVRESVFGVLMPVLGGARVLDLFAGSGALGIEALSRGASECVFVEKNRGACRVIEENLAKTGLEGMVVMREVESFLRSETRKFDLIFADPPYATGLVDPAGDLVEFGGWGDLLEEGGYLILESEARGELLVPVGLELVQEKEYGRSRIGIYRSSV